MTYFFNDLDGKTVVSQTIAKGTAVYVKYRAGNHTFTINPKNILGIEDYSHIPNVSNKKNACIYTDSDIENLLIGENINDMEFMKERVIRKKDGTQLVYVGSLSEKKDDGRKNGLTLLTDTKGVIQDYAFTGTAQKGKPGMLDYIPFVSKAYDMNIFCRFVRGYYSPKEVVEEKAAGTEEEEPLIDIFNQKWYVVALIMIVMFMFIGILFTPAALIPYLFVMWLLLSAKRLSNRAVLNAAKWTSMLVFTFATFLLWMLGDVATGLVLVLPSSFFVFHYFIPELGLEMIAWRCTNCGAWDSFILSGWGQAQSYIEKTTTKVGNVTVDVKEREVGGGIIKYFDCEECGHSIAVATGADTSDNF